jgi:hypothetical protein
MLASGAQGQEVEGSVCAVMPAPGQPAAEAVITY